ncbi:cytochrome b/b6 domain-containing protein [Paraglaciecola aestuariivivens]
MNKYLVWDLPTRLFHWLLVMALLAQWITVKVLDDALWLHAYIGYFTLGLVVFRILWGIWGTKYAKFSQFIAGPKAIFGYLKALFSGQTKLWAGHNPLGGWMLPSTLLLVGIQGVSGLFATDDILTQGPYYSVVDQTWQNTLQWLHANTYYIILGLAGVHILAILSYKWFLHLPLTLAMLNGKKPVDKSQGIKHSKLGLALLLAILVGVFMYWLVGINPPPIEEYYY